jgi:hypothetical protein
MAVTTQKDLIQETSVTTGTGNFTTTGVNGKVRFGDATYGFGTGATTNVFDYYISNRDVNEWERGTGHCSALGTLVRDTVLASSNANALVSFTAGTKDVVNDIPAGTQLRTTNNLSELSDATTARINIYSAPFDAMAYTGIQVNGAMEVSQEVGSTLLTPSTGVPAYIVDQWVGQWQLISGAGSCSFQQVTPPGSPSFNGGFQKCIQAKAVTGGAFGTSAADLVRFYQPIEGYRLARLGWGATGASSITVSFWVYATVTGTATCSVYNSGGTRGYPVNFTVNAANTWEYKTITIPGDTSGTWLKDSSLGCVLNLCFASGSSWQGTNATWGGAAVFATSATSNFFSSTNNVVCVTGVTVLAGTEAPSATRSPYIMRPYTDELLLCKRYWWNTKEASAFIYFSAGGNNTTAQAITVVNYPVEMRGVPTVTVLNQTHFSVLDMGGGSVLATSVGTTGNIGVKSCGFTIAVAAGLTQRAGTLLFANTADGDIQFSARM